MHWTEKYMGIPFKLHGRDEEGLDCWGLIYLIYKDQYGIDLPSYTEKYDNIDEKQALKELQSLYNKERKDNVHSWKEIPNGEEIESDVFLMPMAGLRTHVALCLGGGKMVHITDGTDVSIEDYTTAKWKHRFKRSLVLRHPERAL